MARFYILVCIGLVVVAWSPVQAQFSTFDFLDFNTKVMVDIEQRPQNVDYLKAAIKRELEAKGLTQSANPDLYVNIGVVIKEEVQTRETDIRTDMHYMGQRNYTWEATEVPVGTYNEGTVKIDLVDSRKNTRVWEGTASAVIQKKNSVMQKQIDKRIKKAFKKFDPAKL